MRLAVCEAAPEMAAGDDDWHHLTGRVKEHRPDILLLNEMPFGRWISAVPEPNKDTLLASHRLHEKALEHYTEFGVRSILGTRPTFENDRSVNQAYIWEREDGLTPVHTKQFFPDEEGYYEARWFTRGETHFRAGEIGDLRVGFLICTEVMFNEWARHYGRNRAHVIAVPRAVGRLSLRRWQTALSMAAIVSGCYVVSSNRAGTDSLGQEFGGSGWIFNPFGDLIAETSKDNPVVCAELNLSLAEQAQKEYPCYVEGLPPSEIVKQFR